MLTGSDAARRLGVSRSVVSRMAASGRLPVLARTLSRRAPLFDAEVIEAEAARRRTRCPSL